VIVDRVFKTRYAIMHVREGRQLAFERCEESRCAPINF
jgi:hypothetical protein